MCAQPAVAYFNVLPRHYIEVLREVMRTSQTMAGHKLDIWTEDLPDNKHGR
jgi:hypothetical protein